MAATALLRRRAAVVSATLLLLAGVGQVLTAVLNAQGHEDAALTVGGTSVAVLLVLAFGDLPHPEVATPGRLRRGGGPGGMRGRRRRVAGRCRHPPLVQGCVLIAYLWWRIETCTGWERRATSVLAAALALRSLLFAVLTFATEVWTGPGPLVLLFVVLGPAMYVGVVLPDLVDVRSWVVSAVVFGVAAVTYMAVFVLVMALLEAVGSPEPSLGTTALVGALVAVTFAPTRAAMRGVVEELLFGVRVDPLGAASAVAGTVGDDPLRALQAIRESLNLPYAALLVDGAAVAESGTLSHELAPST